MNDKQREEMWDFINEVAREAQSVTSAFEWGSGSASAEKDLEKAKDNLAKWIEENTFQQCPECPC